MRYLSLTLCCVLAFGRLAAAEEPSIAVRGKLLFEDPMNEAPAADWRVANGRWEAREGTWVVTCLPEEKHGATIRHALPASDAIIAVEFRFPAMNNVRIAFNDDVGHVSRVLAKPDALIVRKDSYLHKSDETLTSVALNLAPNQWHTLTVELKGDRMLARVDGVAAQGAHPDLAKIKTQLALGFGNGDSGVQVRNFRIWEALPPASSE